MDFPFEDIWFEILNFQQRQGENYRNINKRPGGSLSLSENEMDSDIDDDIALPMQKHLGGDKSFSSTISKSPVSEKNVDIDLNRIEDLPIDDETLELTPAQKLKDQ